MLATDESNEHIDFTFNDSKILQFIFKHMFRKVLPNIHALSISILCQIDFVINIIIIMIVKCVAIRSH